MLRQRLQYRKDLQVVSVIARRIDISGIVQGVGFRPFIYHQATRRGLTGEVCNTATGVTIHVEGASENVEAFCRDLTENHPPLAHITDIIVTPVPVACHLRFSITESRNLSGRTTLISPDICVCPDCLREMRDPKDRRFRYPFINCTNCGPRYTIISDIPYDRPNTTMRPFTMCPACRAEYEDPENRRFHAQPNACPDCGPRVVLYDQSMRKLSVVDPIETAIGLLQEGMIVAVKGLGGFHLACDAQNHRAVCRLRIRKHREEKPLALMSPDLERIRSFAEISPGEALLLASPRRPIVLLKKKYPNPISEAVAPDNRYFGAMLPYAPLHFLLLDGDFTALVMTSGNFSNEPIIHDDIEAFDRLSNIADYFLVHDRQIHQRADDSVTRHTSGAERIIRRSRGYAPVPVFLHREIPQILACGGELKNTVCLTKADRAFVSPHIGDLEQPKTLEVFTSTVAHFERIMDIHPKIVAHDMHPDYVSTRYALSLEGRTRIPVQHHHAHIAACMAENRVTGPVIGLSFDGTGYGTDGSIWGGEVLIADYGSFTRAAHLEYLPMPGGAAAITEPWRMAVSCLRHAYQGGFAKLDLPFLRTVDEQKARTIVEMMIKGVNSPMTSSLGRLFDGVAAMVGLHPKITFEGQAAMALEMAAAADIDAGYEYTFEGTDPVRIRTAPIISGVAQDVSAKIPVAVISRKFHNTLIRMFGELCVQIGKTHALHQVALSGGVFQNEILFTGLAAELERSGFEVLTHRIVPCNDGGLSLGQAMIAAASV